jgi:hypothetical protein
MQYLLLIVAEGLETMLIVDQRKKLVEKNGIGRKISEVPDILSLTISNCLPEKMGWCEKTSWLYRNAIRRTLQ